MSTKTIKVENATADELKEFAATHLGITFKPKTPTVAMRAQVKQAWGKAEFTLPEKAEDEPKQQAPAPKTLDSGDVNPTHVTLILNTHDGPGGDEPVPVSVNGRAMLIPRGEEVTIPWAYYEVLKNATELRYEPLENGGMSAARKVLRYPFNRVA